MHACQDPSGSPEHESDPRGLVGPSGWCVGPPHARVLADGRDTRKFAGVQGSTLTGAMRAVMLASLLLVALSARSVDSAKQKVKDPAAAFERRYDAAMAAAREGDLETAYTKVPRLVESWMCSGGGAGFRG